MLNNNKYLNNFQNMKSARYFEVYILDLLGNLSENRPFSASINGDFF